MAFVNKVSYVAAAGLCVYMAANMGGGEDKNVISEDMTINYDDDESVAMAAAAAASGMAHGGLPPGAYVDPVTGQIIDPVTGLPIGPAPGGIFNSSAALAQLGHKSWNAPINYCGRGVANICEAQGLGNFRGIDGHDFGNRATAQGWVLDTRYNQYNAPEGAMLVYNSDKRLGQPLTTGRNGKPTGGSRFGHVEIVTYGAKGRGYTSSHTSQNPGGTVNHNFMGVWVKK